MNPKDALIGGDGEGGGNGVVSRIYSFLGFEKEAFVCPHCEVPCEPSHTYDPDRAAFYDGDCPSWECPNCQTHFVREASDEDHTLDLYDRD